MTVKAGQNASKRAVSRPNALLRPLGWALGIAMLAGGALIAADSTQAYPGGIDSRPVSLAARGGIGSFTPAAADPRLVAQIKLIAKDGSNGTRMFRFTPASAAGEDRRAVTVAVRINDQAARAVSVRTAAVAVATSGGRGAPLKITPAAYNLGVARGYKSFAQTGFVLPNEIRPIEMPDLSAIERVRGKSSAGDEPSRFNTRIALEESHRTGRAPRTLEGEGDVSVDLGGSYSVARNLDLTAGVRLSRERDRLEPLTSEPRDSQAVYVGTQFRF